MQLRQIAPAQLESVLRTEARGPSRWVPARSIQRRIGGTSRGIQRAADVLMSQGRIERAWNVTQWEYRIK